MKLRSRRIYAESGVVDGVLDVRNGTIARIEPGDDPDARDVGDLAIIPGIFDTHNHGTQGYALWPSPDFAAQLDGYLKALASEGVTSVFPTLFGGADRGELTLRAIEAIAVRVESPISGAQALGIHYEGPYLNRVGEKGTRSPAPVIDLGFVREVIQAARGHLRTMGLAPELPGSGALIALLLENGVTAAFTHSDCNAQEAFAAFDNGIRVATHLCNVMTGIHHRDVGGLGASLLDDRVSCELICDGLHVSNDMLRLVLRAKAHEKLLMISDCTGYSGAPAGTYDGLLGNEGVVIVGEDGIVREPGGRLRGSSKPVLYGIGNLVRHCGVPLEEAVRLASLYPAQCYGFGAQKGCLRPGMNADFALIDADFIAQQSYVGGELVFDRTTEGERVFNPALLRKRQEGIA